MASGGRDAGPDADANGSAPGGGMDVDVAEFECREQCYREMTEKAVTKSSQAVLVVLLHFSSAAVGGMDVDMAEFECREQCYGEMTDKAVTTGYRVALVVLLQLSCRSLCDPHRIKAVTVLPSTAT